MNFRSNVIYYRKKLGITQEELAERLHVSRQTVSRWETDSTAPDIEMLVRLCELFDCSLDTLVRGDAEGEASLSEAVADVITPEQRRRQCSSFALLMALGVFLVVAGVCSIFFISMLSEVAAVVCLLSFVTAATAIFIIGGIKHSHFLSDHPTLPEYPEQMKQSFLRISPYIFAGATVLILVGVILLIIMLELLGLEGSEGGEMLAAGIFMSFVCIASTLFTWCGIEYGDLSGKHDKGGNECGEEGLDPKGKRISDAISSAIMLTATAGFLLAGFLWNLWHPAWVVFPVGAILSGIVTSILTTVYPGKKQ